MKHTVSTCLSVLLALSAALAALSGCRVAPRPVPSASFIPSRFAAVPADARQGEPLPEQWWHSFGDPDLNRLVDQALADNFSIRSAWDRLAQAEQLAAQTAAGLLPRLSYNGGYSRTRQETGPLRIDTDRFNAGLSASYELDLWGQVRSARQAAELDVQASRQAVAAAAMTLSARIVQTWFQLAETGLLIDLIQQQLAANEAILTLITTRAQNGQAGSTDVFRQRQLVESTRGQLIQVRQRRQLLQHQLAVLAGRPPESYRPDTAIALPEPGDLPALDLPGAIIHHRPDVRAAWLQIQAADLRVSQAALDRYPRFTLSASTSTSSEKVADLFDDWLATLAGNLAGPLFDAGQRQAELQRTRAVLSQRINDYRQTVLTALGEIEDALANEQHQRHYLANLVQQLELAEQTYRQTREQYLSGQLDYIRVLEAQISRQVLQRNLVSARSQLTAYRVDLCRAIGAGWLGTRPEPATLPGENPQPEASISQADTP